MVAEAPPSFSGRSSKKAVVAGLSPEEARVRAVAEVVNCLIQGVKEGKDVDLNQLKTEVWCGVVELPSPQHMSACADMHLNQQV